MILRKIIKINNVRKKCFNLCSLRNKILNKIKNKKVNLIHSIYLNLEIIKITLNQLKKYNPQKLTEVEHTIFIEDHTVLGIIRSKVRRFLKYGIILYDFYLISMNW
jgi:hypothetical protein